MIHSYQSLSVFSMLGLAALSLIAAPQVSHAAVLFDGSSGTRPDQQGFAYGDNPLFTSSATQTAHAGYTTLDTTAVRSEQAGYFSEDPIFGIVSHPSMPTLDRTAGYTIRMDLKINDEIHDLTRDDNSDGLLDRAGFSIIAISSDILGIEVAFFEDRIWAYSDGDGVAADEFTQAESVLFDTTAAMTRYDVAIASGSYDLFADGQPILSGPLRDYSGLGASPNVYALDSFLFFGDNTSGASASVDLGRVEVLDTAIPEPTASMVMLLGAGALAAARRRPG